jgi:hypothetical protein
MHVVVKTKNKTIEPVVTTNKTKWPSMSLSTSRSNMYCEKKKKIIQIGLIILKC